VRAISVRDTKGNEELPVPSKRLLLQRETSHTVKTRRSYKSGNSSTLFWVVTPYILTGYNVSKKPPAYIYRAEQCGLFNDVTATAQIHNRERPTGEHGRVRLKFLENKKSIP
jgi:hypothetical protein